MRCPRAAEAPAGSFAGSGDTSHACPRSINPVFTTPGLSSDLRPTRTKSPQKQSGPALRLNPQISPPTPALAPVPHFKIIPRDFYISQNTPNCRFHVCHVSLMNTFHCDYCWHYCCETRTHPTHKSDALMAGTEPGLVFRGRSYRGQRGRSEQPPAPQFDLRPTCRRPGLLLCRGRGARQDATCSQCPPKTRDTTGNQILGRILASSTSPCSFGACCISRERKGPRFCVA